MKYIIIIALVCLNLYSDSSSLCEGKFFDKSVRKVLNSLPKDDRESYKILEEKFNSEKTI